jgi:hypothetical protein
MMRWFDRDYVTGGLTDESWSARQTDYAAHIETIRPLLTDGAEHLVTSIQLHDGQVAEWTYQPDASFVVRLLVGDLQRGYEWLTLGYGDASLVSTTESDLGRWWSAELPNEIVEDEVDWIGDHRYEHRMLLWPVGEVGVRFSTLVVGRQPATSSDRR